MIIRTIMIKQKQQLIITIMTMIAHSRPAQTRISRGRLAAAAWPRRDGSSISFSVLYKY